MTSSENGYLEGNLFCNSCLNWKVDLGITCATNAEQMKVTFDAPTVSVIWPIATNALWNITNYFPSTELKCGMASISAKRHCMTRAT